MQKNYNFSVFLFLVIVNLFSNKSTYGMNTDNDIIMSENKKTLCSILPNNRSYHFVSESTAEPILYRENETFYYLYPTFITIEYSNKSIEIASLETGKTIKTYQNAHYVHFNPDKKFIVIHYLDKHVEIVNSETDEIIKSYKNVDCCFHFSPDERFMTIEYLDKRAEIVIPETGKTLKTCTNVAYTDYRSNPKIMAIHYRNGSIEIVNLEDFKTIKTFDNVDGFNFRPKKFIFVSYRDKTSEIISLENFAPYNGIPNNADQATFSPDENFVLLNLRDCKYALVNLEGRKIIKTFSGYFTKLELYDKSIFVGCYGKKMEQIDIKTGETIKTYINVNYEKSSFHEKFVLVLHNDNTVELVNVETSETVKTYTNVYSADLINNEKLLLSHCDNDNTAELINLETYEVVKTFKHFDILKHYSKKYPVFVCSFNHLIQKLIHLETCKTIIEAEATITIEGDFCILQHWGEESLEIFRLSDIMLHMKEPQLEKTCSICLEDLDYSEKEDISFLDCMHPFHKKCIKNWFKTSNNYTCPNCRIEAETFKKNEENSEEQEKIEN